MASQFVQLDGRRFVNSDFVGDVRKLYPATTKKIPLGYSTYVGWTGKDEVLFTQHAPVGGLEGVVYEVMTSAANPGAFSEKILPYVKHREIKASLQAIPAPEPTHVAASAGKYGFARAVERYCDVSTRRLTVRARVLVARAARSDEALVPFLQHHAKQGKSLSARVLLDAADNATSKVATGHHEAASRLGMYGFPVKTARLGLEVCAELRTSAGIIAADLHAAKAALRPKITGYFEAHSKAAKCRASRLILSCYPAEGFEFRRRAATPTDVAGWIALPSDELRS